jgi:hypothetical protein
MKDEDYRAMYLKVRDELAELQQRPWVELTDGEIDAEANSILTSDPVQWWRRLARAVLAKSKEKNT